MLLHSIHSIVCVKKHNEQLNLAARMNKKKTKKNKFEKNRKYKKHI